MRIEQLDPVVRSAWFLCIHGTMEKNHALTKITSVTVGVNSEGPLVNTGPSCASR